MNEFSVDPAELEVASGRLARAAGDASSEAELNCELTQDDVGDTALAIALTEFEISSRRVLDLVLDDVQETANRLAETATAYRDNDAMSSRALEAVYGGIEVESAPK
jgi:hypothetical protein